MPRMSQIAGGQLIPFEWTKPRLAVAELTASGESVRDIAIKTHVSESAILNWRRNPDFWVYVREVAHQLEEQAIGLSIASRLRRVEELDELKRKALATIDQRASQASNDPDMLNEDGSLRPGADTGMLLHDLKTVGSGPGAQVVDTYSFDHAMVKTLISLHERAERELGQRIDKVQVSGDQDNPITFTLTIDRPIEEVNARKPVETIEDGTFVEV